jgi:transcriptional regulator with XRE-family HTH domain
MPPKNTSSKRHDFGLFLGRLRDGLHEGQKEFAERLKYSRPTIANTENGVPPSANLIAALIEEFPERKDQITAEARRWTKSQSSQHAIAQTAIRRRLDALMASNDLRAASEYLRHEFSGHGFDVGYLIWNCEQQSRVEHLRNNRAAGRKALRFGVNLTKLYDGFTTEHYALSEQLATSFFHDGLCDAAHAILDRTLTVTPTMPSIWYLKGLIHFDAGELTDAYAALATALGNKGSRLDILYVRALIYTEWNRFDLANADITAILDQPQLLPAQVACMRSAQTYVLLRSQEPALQPMGDTSHLVRWREKVAQAFSALRNGSAYTSDNPWSFYFHALYLTRYYKGVSDHIEIASQLMEIPRPEGSTELISEIREELLSSLNQALERDDGSLNRYMVARMVTTLEWLNNNANESSTDLRSQEEYEIIVFGKRSYS